MDLTDRFARGLIAGLVAGVVMNIISIVSYSLDITELRFLDWSAIAVYGQKPENLAEAVFAQFAQFIFVGVLGVFFAYLIVAIGNKNYLLKGWLYGSGMWFVLYGITILFHIEATIPLHLDTAATDFIGSTGYGLVLAATLKLLGERVTQE